MKQLIEHLDHGQLELIEAPIPTPGPHQVLVRARATIISTGTERMLVEFGRASLWGKVRQQPQRVRQVVDKVLSDGPRATADAVLSKLRQPIPLGYAMCGEVVALGAGVTGLELGQRVACNGPHAEYALVSSTLCIPAPPALSDLEVASATLCAVALQGVRLGAPTLGERFAVVGLGMLGLLSVQLLRAHGAQVFAVDLLPERAALAKALGAIDAIASSDEATILHMIQQRWPEGLDGVILCASTASSGPMRLAARALRAKGRIILTGVTGMQLERAELYAKELSVQVSCSYGPGRYQRDYEELGADYDPGVVRWTAGRNMLASLELMAQGSLSISSLQIEPYAFEQAPLAYEGLMRGERLGAALTYASCAAKVSAPPQVARVGLGAKPSRRLDPSVRPVRVGVIGAGNYAMRTLLPQLVGVPGLKLVEHVSPSGLSAALAARAFGFERSASQVDGLFEAPDIDMVLILTRHDSHAHLVCRALEAGKHVFVEKPLAIDYAQLEQVRHAHDAHPEQRLIVGFNRRFAPITEQLMAQLPPGPYHLQLTINAGALSADHWSLRADQGGRLVGELCHFVDWARFVVGCAIVDGHSSAKAYEPSTSAWLRFEDGSSASILYTDQGASAFGKERLEVFAAGQVFQIDNWRALRRFGGESATSALVRSLLPSIGLPGQDKGHARMAQALAAKDDPMPDTAALLEVMDWTLRLAGLWP